MPGWSLQNDMRYPNQRRNLKKNFLAEKMDRFLKCFLENPYQKKRKINIQRKKRKFIVNCMLLILRRWKVLKILLKSFNKEALNWQLQLPHPQKIGSLFWNP